MNMLSASGDIFSIVSSNSELNSTAYDINEYLED